MMEQFLAEPLRSWTIASFAILAGLAMQPILLRVLRSAARRTAADWDDLLVAALAPPSRLGAPLLAVQIALPFTRWADGGQTFDRLLQLGWIVAISWILMRLLGQAELLVARRVVLAGTDNLRERRLVTQVRILRQILSACILFFAIALGMMSFDQARRIATGMLTTAGLAGVVIGLSAQKTIGNFLAGIQIAITQPIRIDDVVIVEGDYGRIEEITLTYVVVRVWDQRTIILPIAYFLEKPFQNWTRSSAEILGTIFLSVDHNVSVAGIRTVLDGIVKPHELWDGRVCGLQVTGWDAKAVELRALVSASDSGRCWDLRCAVREALLDHLRREHPESLPRTRVDLREPGRTASLDAPATS